MAKSFEDLFMEIQADMVFACMDYVKGMADKVYVYGSFEGRMISSDWFYEINGQIVARHKTNTISSEYDVSGDNQDECLDELNGAIDDMIDLCKEHKRLMPTEIKMVYDVKKKSLDVNYKYDNQWHDHKTKTPDDVADEWFEEVKNSKQL